MTEVKQRKGWFARLAGRDEAEAEAMPQVSPEESETLPEVTPPPPRSDIQPSADSLPPEPDLPSQAAPAPETERPEKRGWFGMFRRGKAEDEPEPRPEEAPPGPQHEPELPPGLPEETPAPELPPEVPVGPDMPPEIVPEPEIPTEIPAPQEPMAGEAGATMEPLAEKPRVEGGWLARMRAGLSKSSGKLTQGITDLFTKRRLDDESLEELEELLITADLGVATAARVSKRLAKSRFGKQVSPEEIKAALAEEIAEILEPVAQKLEIEPARKPHVVLVVGVNGSGKTTTIGKLAKQYKEAGLTVSLAAGDTFRAAAVEQLKVWGQRTDCPVIARDTGADAAGLAFDALAEARRRGDDVLLIDTAGRLQNKSHLMAELQKIIKVIKKQDETAPHTVLLVLDATVGQNAHSQVEVFREITDVTGLVLTKLDGTARGGVLVALAEKFGLPVHAIGVGERAEDLRPFTADGFARSLVGL